jgi:hypothetical protein
MTGILQAVAGWPGAVFLQQYWIAYLVVNAVHILGIALLLGAILPLDLLLLRSRHAHALPVLGPFLVQVAAAGAALAVTTGLWLFTVKPAEYLENPAFLFKALMLVLAAGNIAVQHRGEHFDTALRSGRPSARVRTLAAASAIVWLSILVAGRWIGFI